MDADCRTGSKRLRTTCLELGETRNPERTRTFLWRVRDGGLRRSFVSLMGGGRDNSETEARGLVHAQRHAANVEAGGSAGARRRSGDPGSTQNIRPLDFCAKSFELSGYSGHSRVSSTGCSIGG